jgi:uncharacterized protein with FMN-binding domain
MNSSSSIAALVISAATAFGSPVAVSAEVAPWSLLSTRTGENSQAVTPEATAPIAPDNPSIELAGNAHHYRDGTYTGPAVDAYYGLVQVQINIQGERLVSVDVLKYPSDRRTSRSINERALPMLESEVITAQSARVDTVSGATLTSSAYLRSINAAFRQAGT